MTPAPLFQRRVSRSRFRWWENFLLAYVSVKRAWFSVILGSKGGGTVPAA